MNNNQLNVIRLKRLTVITVLALLIIIVVLSLSAYRHSQLATVSLDFTPGSGTPTVRFNNKLIKEANKGSYSYSLEKGQYTVAVTDVGYKEFTTSFKLDAKQNIFVNVNLAPSSKPSATNLSKIPTTTTGSQPTTLANLWPDATATAEYFDNNTWAYVKVDTHIGLGLAYLIVQYDSTTGQWVIVRGPIDDSDDIGSLQGLPTDLQNYLMGIGYDNGD